MIISHVHLHLYFIVQQYFSYNVEIRFMVEETGVPWENHQPIYRLYITVYNIQPITVIPNYNRINCILITCCVSPSQHITIKFTVIIINYMYWQFIQDNNNLIYFGNYSLITDLPFNLCTWFFKKQFISCQLFICFNGSKNNRCSRITGYFLLNTSLKFVKNNIKT